MRNKFNKSLLSILTLTSFIISGCATTGKTKEINKDAGFDSYVIKRYQENLEKDEKILSADFKYLDSTFSGKFDIYYVNLNIVKDENSWRIVELSYGYSEKGIAKFPYTLDQTKYEKTGDKEKPEINIEIEKYYDYKGENYSGKEIKVVTDLPALKDFKPDGKFDLKSTVKIKTTPEDIENQIEEDDTKDIPKKRA